MRIFNKEKTHELDISKLDFEKGQLVPDRLLIAHHDAVEAQEAIYVDREEKLDNGSIQIWKDLVTPAVEAKDAYDEYEDIQVYVPYTAEELKERIDKKRYTELKAELAKVMEDIEQEQLGIVRDDYAQKKARAAEIINELRVLEGKEPRIVNT